MPISEKDKKETSNIYNDVLHSKVSGYTKDKISCHRRAIYGLCGRCLFGEVEGLKNQRPVIICESPQKVELRLLPPESLYAELDFGNIRCEGFAPVTKERA